jgi:ornithine cyclodeaminase
MTAWLGCPVHAVATAREAVEDADVIGVATNSREPVFDLGWIKPGSLIISVSGRQLPATVVNSTRVVATTWDSLATRPIFAAAMNAGTFAREDLAAELGAVVCGEVEVRRDPQEIVVFDSNSRIQVWAVRIAHWAYEWALQHQVGTRFQLTGG